MGRRIIYTGNFEPPWSTENHVAAELTALGHQVLAVQENRATLEQIVDAVGQGADLLLVTRSWGWEPAHWLAPTIEAARDRGITTAGFHLDRFWGLGADRVQRVDTDPMFRTDVVFTADGDDDAAFKERGVNHVFLPPGVFTPECYDAPRFTPDDHVGENGVDYARTLDAEVAFVGSYNYHPEWPHRPHMVDKLRAWYGERFLFVGGDGDLPTTRGDDLNRLYSTVPVIVGDSCFAREEARYWSDRFPETWGRGGFLIFPKIDLLYKEIGTYPCWCVGDWDGLHAAIEWALRHPDARDVHREAIGGYVRAHQTYQARLTTMLDYLGVT